MHTLIDMSISSYSPFKSTSCKISPVSSSPTGIADVNEDELSALTEAVLEPQNLNYAFQMATTTNTMSIGSLWTVELNAFRSCGSAFEAIICLRRLAILLMDIQVEDRISFCKSDFDDAVSNVRSRLLRIGVQWSQDLTKELISMNSCFFNKCRFQKLPTVLIQEILMWLNIEDSTTTLCVCREWKELGTSEEIWKIFYHRKFVRNNPNSMPFGIVLDFRSKFKNRLRDPHIGDKVEVAWKGKFRLESTEVYQGLAWWVAEVVDKHTIQRKYKIRYPGWESKWDEWVGRERLRWAVDTNTLTSIRNNDFVELWCCGSNVPGAWLQTQVKGVRNGQYCLSRGSNEGPMWVGRERLRLTKKPPASNEKDCDRDRRELSLILPSNAGHVIDPNPTIPVAVGSSSGSSPCSVM